MSGSKFSAVYKLSLFFLGFGGLIVKLFVRRAYISSGLSISVFFWAKNVNVGKVYMHTNAPTAPSIPAIEPTCGYTTARMKGPTRMPKLSIMLILFDDASGLPVASSKMFDLRHAKIKEQVAVS